MAKRWQPPPMNAPDDTASPKVTLDEGVVRKMLQVNPELRDGRTTFQVKKDMEGGQSVATDGRRATGEVRRSTGPQSAPPTPSTSKSELDDTVGFFMKGRTAELSEKLAALRAQRTALEEQERAVRDAFKTDLAKFVGMLDPQVVAMHGVSALSKHKAILDQVGLTPAQVLQEARKPR